MIFLQDKRKTLEQVLQEVGDQFYIVTKKQTVTMDELMSFVTEARNKKINDFNIAALIKTDRGFVSALMNNQNNV